MYVVGHYLFEVKQKQVQRVVYTSSVVFGWIRLIRSWFGILWGEKGG